MWWNVLWGHFHAYKARWYPFWQLFYQFWLKNYNRLQKILLNRISTITFSKLSVWQYVLFVPASPELYQILKVRYSAIQILTQGLLCRILFSSPCLTHSKLSSIYHMPHHVKKYTNAIRPIFRCIWIKWKPEANKPASFLD